MNAWFDRSLSLDDRVDALLADLDRPARTAIALGDLGPLTSRGLPELSYVDSGTGLRDVPGATAYPAGIALAATFDPELAEAYGAAVGAEARAAGFTVLLGPTLDLARDPRAGRIPEAFGEDPWLSGRLGAAHVRGAQAEHLICQVKHFAAYNGEDRRTGYGMAERGDSMDVAVSDAVLADVYLRPFEDAIAAGAWSLMGSYNRINGEYACENAAILAIARERWGWRGFFCPDFLFAVRDDALALAAGLDLPALGGAAGRTSAMVEAAPPEQIAALVANLVRALIGSGLADDPPGVSASASAGPSAPVSAVAHLALAERTAIASSVLLRNRDSVLPFGPDVTSIALIGPSGADALYVTGGSAAVEPGPERLISPADGVLARAGAVDVRLARGSLGDVPLPVVPAAAFTLPDGSGPGVEVEFVDASGLNWTEVLPAIDHAVDPSAPLERWPRRWRTRLTSDRTGSHRLSLTFGGRAALRVDGRLLAVGSREAEQFIHGPRHPLQTTVELTAGRAVDVEIDYEPGPAIVIPPMGLGPTLRLGWQQPDDLIAEAVAAAAASDVAVVLVNQACGEGMDRDTLALPGDQDALVRAVAAVNSRTVVVLNIPGAVDLPWLDDVAAVLALWYPGERFGAALAAVLFGDAEPGGRLPLTFPRSRRDLPGGDHGPETVPTRLDYDADAGIGYRAVAVREHGAVFAFGHGLGYAQTRCRLVSAGLVDSPVSGVGPVHGGPVPGSVVSGGAVLVEIEVVNLGDRDTVHVAQFYAELGDSGDSGGSGDPGDPSDSSGSRDRELAGLARVPVRAGATAVATATVPASAFARWQPPAGRVPLDGEHLLWLATSSADLTMSVAVAVRSGCITDVRPIDPT